VIFVTGLALLAVLGVPLFALFGAAALGLFLDMPEGSWSSIAIDVFGSKFAQNPTLVTIPLFTFAGYLLAEAGTPRRLVRLARAWFGWMPGGLAVVCLLASAFFTTFTGGSGITIVAIGGLLFPALVGAGYPQRFSLGLVTTGGSLGLLFPPSVPLILYGIVASLVVQKALVAGIVPGLFVMTVLAIYSAFTGARSGVARRPFLLREALASLSESKWELAIPVVLIAGIVSGVLRVHEASAFTALYVLIIEVLVYRDVHLTRDLPRVIVQAITMIGAVLIIMVTAIGFNAWMVQAEVPLRLASWMESIVDSRVVFLLMVNVLLLVVGMLMDIFTAIVVVVPLILPMAYAYEIDPYHMAVIVLLNLEIGYLTPPIGLNLFMSSLRFGRSMTEVYRTVVPFICVLIFTLLVVTYVPALTTWLPEKIRVRGETRSLSGGYIPDALSE
jgi:tripartite ATP-independent transporter DctM subunit